MKKALLFYLLVFLTFGAVTFTACSKEDDEKSTPAEPKAAYSYDIEGDFAPAKVQFTNNSTDATSYEWDFGDGNSTSSLANPSHTYNTGGVYTVTLTATGPGGNHTTSKTINISSPPTQLDLAKIKLTDYPTMDQNGLNWDLASGPDIYFAISDQEMTTLYFTSEVLDDVNYNQLPFSFNNHLPFTLTSLNKTYVISFWDEDLDGSEFIGGYYFTPSEATGYPSTIDFFSNDSYLKFEIVVNWKSSSKKVQGLNVNEELSKSFVPSKNIQNSI